MKRLLLLLVCGLCVFLLSSCQRSVANKSVPDAVIKADGRFPKFLAGTWQAEASKWQVTLAPDGSVISAVDINGLLMVMAEGGVLAEGPAEKTYLYFVFGSSYANYNPETRELNVTVIIKRFHLQVGDAALEGDMKHYFTGPVSRDDRRWYVKLFTYTSLKDQVPSDPNLEKPEIFVFNKVENNQPNTLGNQ